MKISVISIVAKSLTRIRKLIVFSLKENNKFMKSFKNHTNHFFFEFIYLLLCRRKSCYNLMRIGVYTLLDVKFQKIIKKKLY